MSDYVWNGIQRYLMTTWQRSYRGDLCVISGKITLLPAVKKLFVPAVSHVGYLNDDVGVKTYGRLTMWQARYMIPHPTPVGQRILTFYKHSYRTF